MYIGIRGRCLLEDTQNNIRTLSEQDEIAFTIYGELASKSNSRQLVHFGTRPAFIKSYKARNYGRQFELQCPQLKILIDGPVALHANIYYASRRPDLDISLLQDLLQGRIYINDRQVREIHCYGHVDRTNPRAEVIVRRIAGEESIEKSDRRSVQRKDVGQAGGSKVAQTNEFTSTCLVAGADPVDLFRSLRDMVLEHGAKRKYIAINLIDSLG